MFDPELHNTYPGLRSYDQMLADIIAVHVKACCYDSSEAHTFAAALLPAARIAAMQLGRHAENTVRRMGVKG